MCNLIHTLTLNASTSMRTCAEFNSNPEAIACRSAVTAASAAATSDSATAAAAAAVDSPGANEIPICKIDTSHDISQLPRWSAQ